MLPDNHALITVAWILLNVLPLVAIAVLWSFLDALLGIPLLILYLIGVVPYGFFVALPVMVKLFRKPASLHRR